MYSEADDQETLAVLDTLYAEWADTYTHAGEAQGQKKEGASTSLREQALLNELRPIFQQSSFQSILVGLLRDFVKVRLSPYKHNQITNQGSHRIRLRQADVTDDHVERPVEVSSTLYWVSSRIEKSTIQSNWHLVFPSILILLDSTHPKTRSDATVVLSCVLERIDHSILEKTGLAEVIWAAILPNLTALPPITDLKDSVALLRVTYISLISLARLWYSSPCKRSRLLDKLVRDGVIYGMMFQGDKLEIARVELESLTLIINEMGVFFVKHLKYVIPIISSILAHPLGFEHPPQFLLALQTLETIMGVCSPRIANHHAEILRGITTCWRCLRIQDTEDLKPVREALKHAIQTLITISPEAKIDVDAISSIDSYFAELCRE